MTEQSPHKQQETNMDVNTLKLSLEVPTWLSSSFHFRSNKQDSNRKKNKSKLQIRRTQSLPCLATILRFWISDSFSLRPPPVSILIHYKDPNEMARAHCKPAGLVQSIKASIKRCIIAARSRISLKQDVTSDTDSCPSWCSQWWITPVVSRFPS